MRIELLIGVPCDRSGFEQAAGDERRDWLRRFAPCVERGWPAYDEDVAGPLRALARQARALDVHVVTDARLADLAWATGRADAVILMAHWKGEAVLARDLLESRPGPVAERLARVPSLSSLAACVAGLGDDPQSLVDALAGHVAMPQPLAPRDGAFTVLAHPATLAAQRRDELDRHLHGLLRPGNRLELADGLFDADAVERAVAADFTGVLDLTSCQARVLADLIDHRRFGLCGVVRFERDVMPEVAALAIARTVALCRQGAPDYLQARKQALDELDAALRAEAGRSPLARTLDWLRRRVGCTRP